MVINRLVKVSVGLSLSFGLSFSLDLDRNFNLSFYAHNPAIAQIIPSSAGTLVNTQGNQINITGGTQAGGNLFHSFQDFNVNSNQVANFLSNPQTQNILGRINSGNPSVINGLLQVTGGNSNLFLMNPAGIIFGQGASLNVPASFTATTANQIGFGSSVFNAFGENNFSVLTGNPDSFLFTTNQAGSIVNAGNLAVGIGQNISLIAGNSLNTGNLTAPGGEIQLLAVPGTNRVRLSQPGQVLSLEFVPPVSHELRALDLPTLLTGSNLTGIQVDESSQVQVAGINLPNQQGLAIASGRIDVSSVTGNGGVVQVMGDRVAALNSRINANGATGGGTVRLGGEYLGGINTGIAPAFRFNSQRTLVDRNSLIRVNATHTGAGGRAIVWADDTTGFYGRITGRGATERGGFVEVSGRVNLDFDGRVELPGANGLFGSLLLDPTNITIQAAAGNGDGLLPTILAGDTPDPMTISAGALAAIAPTTDINIAATNDITFNVPVVFATCNAGICGDISFTAGGAFNTNGNNLIALGRTLSITAANITTGVINLAIATPLRNGGGLNLNATSTNITTGDISTGSSFLTGATIGNGGNIVISAPNGTISIGNIDSRSVVAGIGNSNRAGDMTITGREVTTGIIAAYSRVNEGSAGDGGNVIIRATNGNITASGITTLSGASISGTAGVGGNITLDATNNINITGVFGNTLDSGLPATVFALDSRSISSGSGNAGNGGNIRINQNLSSNGSFNATGVINSSSAVINTAGDATGNSARGGDINITAQSIFANDTIRTYSNADIGVSGNGGDININATGGSVNLTYSLPYLIHSGTRSGSAGSGNGGNVEIRATQDVIISGSVFNSSVGDTSSGNGGNISINAQNITTSHLVNDSLVNDIGNAGNGGNTTLNAQNNLNLGIIYAASRVGSGSGFSGNGGNINLNAINGNIRLQHINSDSFSDNLGIGGRVDINAGNLFLATESAFSRGGTLASISAQGGAGGGAITITHGGSTIAPFLVGNGLVTATVNGTAAAITSGPGANTLSNLIVPVPPVINNYGTNISIRTTAPTPTSTITPFPLDLVLLLTNPAPPFTPAPIVVGTPPVVADNPEFVPAPVIDTIAPPIPPPTPPIITPSPTPLIPPNPSVVPNLTNDPQPERPGNLDPTTPSVQTSLATATSKINLPIITQIPVSSLRDNIRLLDQPFKEEFQLFTGLTNEIATLDANQAQDILQRIIRETNTKPVFIYVFFAPENDIDRNADSARGGIFRTPNDTDILEVVLVPPTGDLIRVRHPGLRYPQVIDTARRFVSLTASNSNGYLGAARQFHEWIIAPLQDELKKREIDNLVFLMDIGLRSMPLAAMRDKNNGDRFIIEDYSVGLMPSLTLTDTSYTSLKGSEVLGMGSANFVEKSPLPGVPLELNAINQLWGGNTLINENFTLTNLRQARRPGQRIVHLATHGSFNSGDKSNSYIQLWGNERLTLDQIRQAGWGAPPVDLLVLSACQTALGDREAEIGFAGLAVQAGVKSALASLWLVSDEGTFGLMTEFYQRLRETTTKSEALRLAQLAMLRGEVRLEGGNLITPQGNFPLNEELKKLGDRTLQHPYFWSGFTMVGNPW
jgi:filamentous hemagglutinin family protein